MSHQYCIRKEIDITKYTEIRKLGHGSFGYVTLVQEKGTGNLYALKTLKKLSDDDESQYREIEIMMFSNNPTIIRCFGYLTKEDKIYILMEYASKGSLDTVLKNIQNGIGPEEYTNTTRQIILIGIARAMKYLHERNIVHRDLKPGNILLDDKFHPIVSDFGQSKFLDAGDPFAQSQICGTYLYMAPEAWGKNEYDGKKADVFSFGILMYEVVYDSSPYNEFLQKKTKEEINRLMIKISNDNFRPTIIDKNNKNLQDLIQQCWAENPIERPTFDEILNKLTNETILNDVDINDVEMYSEDINSTYDLYDDFLKKIESLETKNMQLIDENERFSNDINILRSKIDELNNENQLLTSKTCKFNINNHLLSNLNKKLTTKNQQLTERIHDLEISVYATLNINDFNSLPLKMQQFIIAKEVNMNYTGINAYFIKINNLLLYLLENKNLQYYNCFEIYHKNKEFLLSEITEECHIILTYKTIEILDNMDLLNSDKFKDLLKVFNKFSIEIRYPSESFVHMLDKTSKLSSLFNKNQCIIGLFISDNNGVDLKIENENKISYIHFDSSVQSIRCSSINFDYRSSIKYIHIPSSLTNIGYYAFQKCSSLKKITIPDSVTIIRDNAFNGCSSLKKVIIPNSVKTIGAGAFRSCTLLKKIALPNSITAIEVDTFRECTSLKEIDIPNSVIDIKDNAFYKCQNLENLSLHYNLENIHSYAFSKCTSLRHVYFPSSVKNLYHAAFQHCTNLYSIDLKSSPLTIGYSVFDGCSDLNEVEVYEGTSIYSWGFPKKTIVKTLKK